MTESTEGRVALALEATALRSGYDSVIAVNDATVAVHRGEIVSVAGPNGAGKTTLLQTIIGTIAMRAGSLRLHGVDVTRASCIKRVRAGCAIVPEGRRLFVGMSVEENLRIGARAIKRTEFDARARIVYELFPKLWALRGRHAGALSGGEQQMCAIGRALMAGPSLLLVDELSLGLAPVIADEVASRLVALKATGIGVVVVDQDIVRCRETSDRMYFMYGGTTSGGDRVDSYQIDELPLWGPPGTGTPDRS